MIPRRSFLGWSTAAAAAGALGPLAGCGGVPVLTRRASSGRFLVSLAEFRATAGPEQAIAVDVGAGWPVLLGARADGSFFALSSRCTHQACRVRPTEDALVCPCHGSSFDRDGRVLRGPAQRPLDAYPVSVDDGAVTVTVAP